MRVKWAVPILVAGAGLAACQLETSPLVTDVQTSAQGEALPVDVAPASPAVGGLVMEAAAGQGAPPMEVAFTPRPAAPVSQASEADTEAASDADAGPPGAPDEDSNNADPPDQNAAQAAEDSGDPMTDAGQSGEHEGEDAAPEVDKPVPGAQFAPCTSNIECDAGLICTAGSSTQPPEASQGFCTIFCDPLNAPECPQPADGTVEARCVGFLCRLQDCLDAACPSGMECMPATVELSTGAEPIDVYQCAVP